MRSPYGNPGASAYYQHAGTRRHYVYNWQGLPPGPSYAAETRALGCDDFVDVIATAHYHKSLGDYPVAMTALTGKGSVLHSGPEQTRIYDGLGLFEGFSRNEKRLALAAVVGIAGYLAYRYRKK
jgi:hypothetical protein